MLTFWETHFIAKDDVCILFEIELYMKSSFLYILFRKIQTN